MISIFSLLAHASTIISIALVLLTIAAIFYVPPVLRHYVIAALLLAAGASQIFGEGFRQSESAWKIKWAQREREYSDTIRSLAEANEKAIIAAEKKAREQAAANAAALSQQLDQETQARQQAEAETRTMRERIAQAPKSADDAAPPLILDVIHGGGK